MNFNFTIPPIIFGNGKRFDANSFFLNRGTKRLCLITDENLSQLYDDIISDLTNNNFKVFIFNKVKNEPNIDIIDQAIQFVRSHDIQGVIGLGGGSCLDVAKAAALLANDVCFFEDLIKERTTMSTGLPLVLLPTTAGTGSEVTSGISYTGSGSNKSSIGHPGLRASLAIIDPELTMSLPRSVTIFSCLDALSHAIESYASPKATSWTKQMALSANKRIANNFDRITSGSMDLESRTQTILASLEAGISLANAGGGLGHAISYPISSLVKYPHGGIMGIITPWALRFNCSNLPLVYEKILEAWSTDTISKKQSSSINDLLDVFQKRIKEALTKNKIANRLSNIGITNDAINEISSQTIRMKRLVENNPCKVSNSDIIEILKKAF